MQRELVVEIPNEVLRLDLLWRIIHPTDGFYNTPLKEVSLCQRDEGVREAGLRGVGE
jgi:hypothetical protein